MDYKNPNEDPYKDLINDVFRRAKNQEHLIELLRQNDFRFFSYTGLIDRVKIKPFTKACTRSQYMMRLVKTEGILEEEYDQEIVFGFRIVGNPRKRVFIYRKEKDKEKLTLYQIRSLETVRVNIINFKKKKKRFNFPKDMSLDDRELFRTEHDLLLKHPDLTPSSFYTKSLKIVDVL